MALPDTQPGTIIATFDEDGEILAWVMIALEIDMNQIFHNNDEEDPIRTYATDVLDIANKQDIDEALDFLAQVHAIDAKNRR